LSLQCECQPKSIVPVSVGFITSDNRYAEVQNCFWEERDYSFSKQLKVPRNLSKVKGNLSVSAAYVLTFGSLSLSFFLSFIWQKGFKKQTAKVYKYTIFLPIEKVDSHLARRGSIYFKFTTRLTF
jgi:hypothetical protein